MHMDVKEPAKLGVRFNWCKCVAGRFTDSTSPPVPAGLSSEGGQRLHEAGTAAAPSGV